MPKKKSPQPADPDAEIIQGILLALIEGYGRGGKTYVAKRIGVKLSMLTKRMKLPGFGLDPFTLKAITLALTSKAEEADPDATRHGNHLISIQDGEPVWTPAEQPNEP